MNFTIVRALCVIAAIQTAAVAQLTWIQNPANGHTYALTSPLSWAAAEAFAIAQGGHLATVRSAGEQTWIYQTFGSGLLWIGFTDTANEGSWSWSSGEPVTYTHWCNNEPNDASGEDFANLSGCGGWNDVEDTVLIPGIIELHGPFASYAVFGTGCDDATGLLPTLAVGTGGVPRIGTTSQLHLTGLPPAPTVPIFLVGFSNTWDSSGYALPLDLGILELPGCTQLVSDDISYWTITTTGTADQGLFVPPGTPFGLQFYVQALVLYFPSGMALSNGVAGVVGY